MSQDSIGVVTTGRGKLQEWKTTQKRNLSRKSRGTLTVKWAGSRDKIFSPSGRGGAFFLTSLFIELIDWIPPVPRFNERGLFSTAIPLGVRYRHQLSPVKVPRSGDQLKYHAEVLR